MVLFPRSRKLFFLPYYLTAFCRICKIVTLYNNLEEMSVNAISHANSIWHLVCAAGNEVRVVAHDEIEKYINFLDIYAGS